jgi:hypothetical protein
MTDERTIAMLADAMLDEARQDHDLEQALPCILRLTQLLAEPAEQTVERLQCALPSPIAHRAIDLLESALHCGVLADRHRNDVPRPEPGGNPPTSALDH